ncbi:hypothetical protein SDC9_125520 [bioreactor metagenome]|uniref:DeoR C-terminal sensor domain-containing protein n=1 Tax=bioreactor metagenome TaxID=1076179 RepID=A0A645CNN8_9ZZZZ
MLRQARRRYLVIDHTKLDKINFYRIGGFDLINGLVIDRLEDPDWRRFFREKGISVVEAEERRGAGAP